MERLQFATDTPYSALEASIHVARYALVRTACRNKAVLDVACGEGYGSYLLAKWGAKSVDGVDISREAIEVAQSKFQHPNVRYHVGNAESLKATVAAAKYEVIISLETIEHLQDPRAFLAALGDMAAPEATIVISCPNDHWYYSLDESNPHHARKYRFQEFVELAEGVLGKARSWRIGSLTAGFANLRLDSPLLAGTGQDQAALIEVEDVGAGLLVPAEELSRPSDEDCSYFVGVWGPDITGTSAVTFPLSMDAAARPLFGGPDPTEAQRRIRQLEQRNEEVELRLRDCETALRHARLHAEAERVENAVLRESALYYQSLKRELEARLAEVPWRVVATYRTIRPFIPLAFLKTAVGFVRLFRARAK